MVQQCVTPYINVARVARTHGKKGEVVIDAIDGLPFCLYPGMRVCLTPPPLRGERFFTVARVGDQDRPLVTFEGVDGIGEAEKLVGRLVLASREDVPEACEQQALMDCVGCRVVDVERGYIGTVAEYIELPANDVWRLEGGPFGEVLLPVIDDVVVSLPGEDDPDVTVRVLPGLI